jgi:hypothetical protein
VKAGKRIFNRQNYFANYAGNMINITNLRLKSVCQRGKQ